jgi:hypothetical protein
MPEPIPPPSAEDLARDLARLYGLPVGYPLGYGEWRCVIRRALAAEERAKQLETAEAENERLRAEVERLSRAVVEGLEEER